MLLLPVGAGVGAPADLVLPVPALLAGDLPKAQLPPLTGEAELLTRVSVLDQLGANPGTNEVLVFYQNHR